MKILNIVLLVVIGVVVLTACLVNFVSYRKRKKQAKKSPEVLSSGKDVTSPSAVQTKQDIVVSVHQTLVAQSQGQLKPGKYTVLSTAEGKEKFFVRIGKFVKECKHGDVVVLAEGDEITPTSQTIILR